MTAPKSSSRARSRKKAKAAPASRRAGSGQAGAAKKRQGKPSKAAGKTKSGSASARASLKTHRTAKGKGAKAKRRMQRPAKIEVAHVATDSPTDIPVAVESLPSEPSNPDPNRDLDARPHQWFNVTAAVISLACSVVLWIAAMPLIEPRHMTDFGMPSVVTWHFWLSISCAVFAFVFSLALDRLRWLMAALSLLVLISILHLTQSFIYEYARYSWAWKHIGVVDFIQRHGWVDPGVRFLNVYHSWPAFFLAAAWIADLFKAGPLDIAGAIRFAPAVFQVLNVLALILLYRNFNRNSELILTAACIFIAGNWIGQDYFSPQAAAFLFYLLLLCLCTGPLKTHISWLGRFRVFDRFHVPETDLARPLTLSVSVLLAVLLILLIAATHQLTPIMVILALASLAVIGRLSWVYFVIAILAEATYLLYFATPYVAANLADQIEGLWQGVAASSARLVDTDRVAPGMGFVVIIGRMVVTAIVLLAIVGVLRQFLARRIDLLPAVLGTVPFLLFANAYDGEIMFRVYLFTLPFLSYFAAAAFFSGVAVRPGVLSRSVLAVVLSCLAIGFIIANTGKDREYAFTRSEVSAATWIYANAPAGTLLIEGSTNYPGQFMNYENFFYVPLAREEPAEREKILQDPAGIFVRWIQSGGYNSAYVLITRSQKAGVDALEHDSSGYLDQIERALLESSRFRVVFANKDAHVFALSLTPDILNPPLK
jgi:hypothetical protein